MMPDSLNEILEDRIIRHLLFLTRLSSREANWVRDQIEQGLFPELMDDIAAGIVRIKAKEGAANLITNAQSKELDKLISTLGSKSDDFFEGLKTNLFSRLNKIAKNEVDFEKRLFQKNIPIDWDFGDVADSKLKALLEKQPVDGKPLGTWFDDLGPKNIDRVSQAIRQGMLAGESIDDMVRRIRGTRASGFNNGILSTTTTHAEALARSGVIHASNQATNEFYRQNDDLIKGIRVLTALDSSVCVICASYDAENPYDLEGHPSPPFHIRCRCTTVAITKSWRELGIDLDEAPEGTRASMDGQVPESTSYADWLAKQDDDIVIEALGPGKAKKYLSGELEVTDFTDRQNRLLSLRQINEIEADVMGAAPVIRTSNLDEHKQQVKEYFGELTTPEIHALSDYSGTHYTFINQSYRAGSDIPEMFQNTDALLKPMIESAPKYEGQIYRGINSDDSSLFARFAGYSKGDRFTDDAYLSASLKESVATNFSTYESAPYEIVLNIQAKNGVYIANQSLSRFEEEVLLGPGSQLRVLGKKVTGNRVVLDLIEE